MSDRRVFLNYRREETRHITGRIADRVGPERVFMDVDTIEPGADFGIVITRAVESCAVLVAVIGRNWLTVTDHRGRRRLDDPDDLVVLEIGAALRRGILVVPVLVDGADMPQPDALPEMLRGLTRRNAIRIDHESFTADVGRLLAVVEDVLRTMPPPASAAEPDQVTRAEPAPSPARLDELMLLARGQGSTVKGAVRVIAAIMRPGERVLGVVGLGLSLWFACGVVVTESVMYLGTDELSKRWATLWQSVPPICRVGEHVVAIPIDMIDGDLRWDDKRVVVAMKFAPDVILRAVDQSRVKKINEWLAAARRG